MFIDDDENLDDDNFKDKDKKFILKLINKTDLPELGNIDFDQKADVKMD